MKLILHVGHHKTGSKALQYFLSKNRNLLLKKKVLYDLRHSDQSCHAYQHSHYHWFNKLRQSYEQRLQTEPSNFERFFLEQIEFAQENIAKTIVISSEDMFVMQTAHETKTNIKLLIYSIKKISSLCQKFDIDLSVIIYTRSPDEFIRSSYAQYIKGESKGTLNFNQFIAEFNSRSDPQKIISIWRKYLKTGMLITRKYSNEKAWDIRRDFLCHILNLPTAQIDFTYPNNIHDRREVLNASPPPIHIFLLRILNKYPKLKKIFN